MVLNAGSGVWVYDSGIRPIPLSVLRHPYKYTFNTNIVVLCLSPLFLPDLLGTVYHKSLSTTWLTGWWKSQQLGGLWVIYWAKSHHLVEKHHSNAQLLSESMTYIVSVQSKLIRELLPAAQASTGRNPTSHPSRHPLSKSCTHLYTRDPQLVNHAAN